MFLLPDPDAFSALFSTLQAQRWGWLLPAACSPLALPPVISASLWQCICCLLLPVQKDFLLHLLETCPSDRLCVCYPPHLPQLSQPSSPVSQLFLRPSLQPLLHPPTSPHILPGFPLTCFTAFSLADSLALVTGPACTYCLSPQPRLQPVLSSYLLLTVPLVRDISSTVMPVYTYSRCQNDHFSSALWLFYPFVPISPFPSFISSQSFVSTPSPCCPWSLPQLQHPFDLSRCTVTHLICSLGLSFHSSTSSKCSLTAPITQKTTKPLHIAACCDTVPVLPSLHRPVSQPPPCCCSLSSVAACP